MNAAARRDRHARIMGKESPLRQICACQKPSARMSFYFAAWVCEKCGAALVTEDEALHPKVHA